MANFGSNYLIRADNLQIVVRAYDSEIRLSKKTPLPELQNGRRNF